MPLEIKSPIETCSKCPLGGCVIYIREQSRRMKDRDTQYRLIQNTAAACSFDSFVPGFGNPDMADCSLFELLERMVGNAITAGKHFESTGKFVEVEKSFFLTPQQIGKVRGDVFQMLLNSILWNCSVERNRTNKRKYAIISVGDNYDLKKLFQKRFSIQLEEFENSLSDKGTSLCYSTPDLLVFDISKLTKDVAKTFSQEIENLGLENQKVLTRSRSMLEGKVDPSWLVAAAGVKTSIRSDRMYQFLFEANAWKYLFRRVFGSTSTKFYSLVTGTYGANPEKLKSVNFCSAPESPEPAIDGVVVVHTANDLKNWASSILS